VDFPRARAAAGYAGEAQGIVLYSRHPQNGSSHVGDGTVSIR
jgi:hypothetical protein